MGDREHGPFGSEREAMATRAAVALRAACDASPGTWEAEHLRVMTGACEAAGVELGAFDLAPFRQLAMYEPFHAVVIAGIIRRAYEAGKAAAPEPAETQWGIRYPAGHPEEHVRNFGAGDGEQAARMLLPDHQRIYRGRAELVYRDIGPWKEAPDA